MEWSRLEYGVNVLQNVGGVPVSVLNSGSSAHTRAITDLCLQCFQSTVIYVQYVTSPRKSDDMGVRNLL